MDVSALQTLERNFEKEQDYVILCTRLWSEYRLEAENEIALEKKSTGLTTSEWVATIRELKEKYVVR